MNPSPPPNRQKLEVPTEGCGCGNEGAFGTWKSAQDQGRALGETRLGRLILASRRVLERLMKRHCRE